MNFSQISNFFANFCWNAWCCLSVIGIWPRFIEHKLLKKTSLKLQISKLPFDLQGLKIAQFSDLHLHAKVSDRFLHKIKQKIDSYQPDIIFFTGDFLCFSLCLDLERLQKFLNSLHAPLGCFAVLGNHDYAEFVSVNPEGNYDVLDSKTGSLGKIFKRLWTKTVLTRQTTERAKAVTFNETLEDLLKKTPFKLLKNETVLQPVKNSFLNITGIEEYITGRCNLLKAFQNFDPNYPGIILAHNPDSVPSLLKYPGEVILCGHTHGGQVNLPWLWKKFTLMENPQFKRGLVRVLNKWIYINRGVGSIMQFRWFAKPEILLLTLERL